ncbi:MAG TPA: tetratricopeptide repeat protein [Candidatus Wallbacteria bacterium]|nr:tetratricopeptide repeat protein [Candidatus Wallbacteria bacterium]
MSIDKITKDILIKEENLDEERQTRVLQFLKKAKTTRDRSLLISELKNIFDSDPSVAENIFLQLLHNDLPFIRRIALSFYDQFNPKSLAAQIKNVLLIEEDAENLNMCFSFVAGTIDRSELSELMNFAVASKSHKNQALLAFLEKECAALNVDYKRMLDNAALFRKQASSKRVEKIEQKNKPAEGLVITDVIGEKIRDKKTMTYAAIVATVIIAGFFILQLFSMLTQSSSLKAALLKIDAFDEKEARASLSEFCQDYPDNLEGLFHLHRLCCENYEIIEANGILDKILSLRSSSYFSRAAEIRNAVSSGDMKTAAGYFNKEATGLMNITDIEYLKLHYEFANARLSKATPPDEYKNLFESLERLSKKELRGYKPYILNLLTTAAADGGLFERAAPYFAEISKNSATDFKASAACAYFCEKNRKFDEAVSYLAKVIEAKPPEAVYEYACINAGRLSAKLLKYSEAVEYYSRWREIRPDSVEPLLALIEAYGETKNAGGLNAAFNDAVKRFPGDPLVYYNYAVVQMKTKEFDEAAKNFKKALSLNADLIEANYNIGRCLQGISDKFEAHSTPWNQCLIDATDYYKKCTAKNPNYEPAYISLGVIAMSKNPPDYIAAAENFNRALKINQLSKEALFNMLAIGYLKNDAKMVERFKAEIIKKFADNEEIKEKLKVYANAKRSGE